MMLVKQLVIANDKSFLSDDHFAQVIVDIYGHFSQMLDRYLCVVMDVVASRIFYNFFHIFC
jgi:hypothetical protein